MGVKRTSLTVALISVAGVLVYALLRSVVLGQ
jgi:hypothetical protein